MVLSMLGTAALAAPAGYHDVSGHWAENAIDRWSGYGVVSGRGDGSFAPNANMTRAEMAQLYVNLLGLTEKADISGFTDVPANAWYADAVAKCVAAGILNGTSSSTLSPLGTVTREQMFVSFGRAMGVKPAETTDSSLSDLGEVSGWAEGMINALLDAGYVTGMENNTLQPLADINRASVMSLMDKTVAVYANEPGATVETEGDGGLVLVVSDGVTVTGAVGDVVIAQGAAEGTVTLKDATVSGTVTVAAPESRLNVAGGTKVENMVVSAAAQGAGVAVSKDAAVGSVTTAAEDTSLSVSGKVESVTVEETAGNASVTADKGAAVGTVTTAGSNTTVSGSGTVSKVEAAEGSTGATVTTPNTTVENNGSGSVTTDKGEVKPGDSTTTKPSTGGGSSSGGSSGGGSSHSHSYTDGVCSADGAIDPAAAQVSSEAELSAALAAHKALIVLTGSFEVNARITVSYPLTLNGNGKTISAGEGWTGSTNLDKHLLCVDGENAKDVAIKNLTFDSTGRAYGIQAYGVTGVKLENVTAKGSLGAGLTVNSASVTAVGLHTSGNAWGGVNVDIKVASGSASFTFDAGSAFDEGAGKPAVYSERADVTVHAPEGYVRTQYGSYYVWAKLFNGGLGTEESPYEIATAEQFANINLFSAAMKAGTPYYFKQMADITGFAAPVSALCGEYDGGHHRIVASSASAKKAVCLFSGVYGTTTIRDLTLVSGPSVGLTTTVDPWYVDHLTISGITAESEGTVILENQSNFGFLMMGCVFDYRSNPTAPQEIVIENCSVNASVQNTADCTAGFIGAGYYPAETKAMCPRLVIRNCTMNGNVSGNTYAGLVFGNPSYHAIIDKMLTNSSITEEAERLAAVKELVVLENVAFHGSVEAKSAGLFSANNSKILLNEAYQGAVKGSYTINGDVYDALTGLDLKVYAADSGYQINDQLYTYKLIFKVQAIDVADGTMNGRDVMLPLTYAEKPDEGRLLKTGAAIHAYDFKTAKEQHIIGEEDSLEYRYSCEGIPVAVVTDGENTYLIFDSNYVQHVDSTVTTYVYGYDGSDYVGSKVLNQAGNN